MQALEFQQAELLNNKYLSGVLLSGTFTVLAGCSFEGGEGHAMGPVQEQPG